MNVRPKVVVVGGGTGAYTVLRGLKRYPCDLTAIVTMADDGGSSGRLRDEFGHLPPGDTRRCLIAMSESMEVSRTLRDLFEYRFDRGDGLNGHSFGNLFLTALNEITGSVDAALREAARLLNVKGEVLPVSTDNVRLNAELADGTIIIGEHNIDVRQANPDVPIRRVFLSPEATIHPQAAQAIRDADILVLGPGDLYTSLIPNLLVRGAPEAFRACRGTRIYVGNLMTKHGETDGFALSDFVREVTRYLGGTGAIDCVIANKPTFTDDVLNRYAIEKAFPVVVDRFKTESYVPTVIERSVSITGALVRHDSHALASTIMGAGAAGLGRAELHAVNAVMAVGFGT